MSDPLVPDFVICRCGNRVQVISGAYLEQHKRRVELEAFDRGGEPIAGVYVMVACELGNAILKRS